MIVICFCSDRPAQAVTNVFFNSSQSTNLFASGTTSDTISSEGYLFTLTRDKLFTGGSTEPTGRMLRVPWPDGMEAQAVTAGPVHGPARIDLRRQDGERFAIESFTAKILANTAGAGASFEIMPLLNGEDGFPNPFVYDATGYAGRIFSYTTPQLTGFDAYKITLYVDYALLTLTVVDPSIPPPLVDIVQTPLGTLMLSWPTNAAGYGLEYATNLPATLWSPVTNSLSVNGDFFEVELEPSGSQKFFRLRK